MISAIVVGLVKASLMDSLYKRAAATLSQSLHTHVSEETVEAMWEGALAAAKGDTSVAWGKMLKEIQNMGKSRPHKKRPRARRRRRSQLVT